MTPTTVMAESPAEVSTRQTPSDTMSQVNADSSENTLKNSVVADSAILRPQRSAIQLATSEPMNIPTNDSDVTYAIWLTVRPHGLISLGAVVAKLLMSANSKKYANDNAASMTLWKRAMGNRSSRFAALECCMSGFLRWMWTSQGRSSGQ